MEIPSFQIIVAQGVCESIPWSALSFAPLWLDLIGFSHETQAFLMTLFVIAGSLGGLFGGRMGDMLAQFWENNSISDKFRFCNPSCCSFGVDITCDPFTAFVHGLDGVLCSSSRVRLPSPHSIRMLLPSPIFAGIVPEKSRTSVESLLASFTPSIVGALAQDFYGYRPIPKISSGSIEMETNRQNAAPLPGHCTQRLGFQWQSVASFTNSFSARIQETGREQGCMHYLSQKSCNK
ncbi:hypothetical protein QQP08_001913 [Theobroma cacao]|nr:hypothetical protein QQP08_001913 [Theobroma cacao]